MSEKIKVAIIGCGAIANSAHIPAYMKNEKGGDKVFLRYYPRESGRCGRKIRLRKSGL